MELANIKVTRREEQVLRTLRDSGKASLQSIGGRYMRDLMVGLTKEPKRLVNVNSGYFWLSERGKKWLTNHDMNQAKLGRYKNQDVRRIPSGGEQLRDLKDVVKTLIAKINVLEDEVRDLKRWKQNYHGSGQRS